MVIQCSLKYRGAKRENKALESVLVSIKSVWKVYKGTVLSNLRNNQFQKLI